MDLDSGPQGEPQPPDPGGSAGPSGAPKNIPISANSLGGATEGVAKGARQGTDGTRNPEKWRWRPLSMSVLPGFVGDPLLFPEQATQLQVRHSALGRCPK